jgi:hypothetical protein
VFWCPVTGVTTSGSSYPRTELREAHSDGSAYNWAYTSFDSSLKAHLSVTQVPDTGKVTVGQLHGTANAFIKLIYNGTLQDIELEMRDLPTGPNLPRVMLANNIKLGDPIAYEIDLSKNGLLLITVNGFQYSKQIDPAWATEGLWFQVGVYPQDNTGPDTEGGRVVFTDLVVVHSGS